ncbi:MAG TPA: hypothetical protein DEA08_37265 [Planctomycetes bacterium]|nr:hypothetical protein [Planctomycetota bacterium]
MKRSLLGPISLCLVACLGCFGSSRLEASPPLEARPLELEGVALELSGVARVKGGYLLADDELVGTLLFVSDEELAGGRPIATLVKPERKRGDTAELEGLTKLFPIQDFEGLAADRKGQRVYMLGSHCGKQKKSKWERRADREFILQAEWKKGELVVPTRKESDEELGRYRRLIDDLSREDDDDDRFEGLNAEGLTLEGDDLIVGLRAPLSSAGKAQLFRAPVERVFSGRKVKWSALELDLEGGGVRGLHWDRERELLFVLSGATSDDPETANALWSCGKNGETLTRVHTFPKSARAFPEGLCRAGEELLIVVDAEGAKRAPMLRLAFPK